MSGSLLLAGHRNGATSQCCATGKLTLKNRKLQVLGTASREELQYSASPQKGLRYLPELLGILGRQRSSELLLHALDERCRN